MNGAVLRTPGAAGVPGLPALPVLPGATGPQAGGAPSSGPSSAGGGAPQAGESNGQQGDIIGVLIGGLTP